MIGEDLSDLNELIRMIMDLLWLIIGLYVLIYLRAPAKELFHRLATAQKGEIAISRDELKVTYEGVAETAANLGAWAQARGAANDAQIHQLAKALAEAAESGAIKRLAGKRVLWVDDEPSNNEYGVKALQSRDVEVITAKSTQEALNEIRKNKAFNAIITDQLRIEEGVRKDRAGYELIQALKEMGVETPVILSTAFPNRDEAFRRGFFDATNTQYGVFKLVMRALQSE